MKILRKILKSKKKQRVFRALVAIFAIVLISGVSLYGLSAIAKAAMSYYSGSSSEVSSNYDIINKISKQVKLPTEEVKVLLKVKNPESLKQEADFYKDVKKDDYILVYPSLAIIYDANLDKVVKIINF